MSGSMWLGGVCRRSNLQAPWRAPVDLLSGKRYGTPDRSPVRGLDPVSGFRADNTGVIVRSLESKMPREMQEREGGKTGTADNSLEGYLQPRRHAAWRRNCRPGKQTRKVDRSEERRVGKECRLRRSMDKKKKEKKEA